MQLKQIGIIGSIFTILCGQEIIQQNHCCTMPIMLSSDLGPDKNESVQGGEK